MIVTAATSATPMVSAEAVMAVRPGARMALRRASMAAGPARGLAPGARGRRRRPARCAPAGAAGARLRRRRAAPRPAPRASRATPARGRRPASRAMPTSSETTIVRVAKTVPVCGRSRPERLEQRVEALGQAEAGGEADRAGGRADGQRLDHDRAAAPGGATRRPAAAARTRASAGRPMIESELKIVNAPTSSATPPKPEQHALDDRDELLQPVEREAVLLGRGLDLGLRQRRGQVAAHLRRRRRRRAPSTRIESYAPGLVEQVLRGVQVEDRDRRGAQRLDGAERRRCR